MKQASSASGLILLFWLGSLLFFFSFAYAIPTHLDKTKNSKGCSECHKGHGKSGTTLLTRSKEEVCLTCHSASGKAADILTELSKPYNHRILETARFHLPGENLSGQDRSVPRHASCYDCHNVHKSEKKDKFKGLRAHSGKGLAPKKQVRREYELCYICHGDSQNFADEKTDISLDFSPSNPSYHPVETYGKNSYVPSLKQPFNVSSLIDCSDCHGNDNAAGPKGPHGSTYASILRYRYAQKNESESPFAYQLCYVCHERQSILNDESFRAHKTHIVFNKISCAQCHGAHGSRFNPSLINFDSSVAFPNSAGEMSFQPVVRGKPRCYLTCHVNGRSYGHILDKNLVYSVNNKSQAQW